MEGFVKMARNIPEWIEQHPEAFHLLAYIARRARRTPGAVTFRGETIELDYGEFIIGRTSASERLGISERKYRTAYKVLLKNKQILTIKTTNRYTIGKLISSLIFDINSEDKRPTERPLGDQQATTNKNDKNEKKKQAFQKSQEVYTVEKAKQLNDKQLLALIGNWAKEGADEVLLGEASSRGLI